jgi:hypothetical protein
MTLRPTDMLEIQTAIDEYERKFPRRPEPSAEVALAWRLGKREAARVLSRINGDVKAQPDFEEQECSRFTWAFEQMKLRWDRWSPAHGEPSEPGELSENMTPWVRGVLVVGGWSAGAVVAVSLFFVGALVGGFK